ncbi:hypothetical protein M1B35_17845 [Pseudomonas sp. MAFF 302046]|uniref:Tetratricopeptide repeat protein n=1 Tax=Pseudomonas morbosilactucae TaxID=2938197 RepID=A0ABT0JJ60_9PSED|nr:hypothetical protein [Pseudomonas morbosilactucae]MCK9815938.1 hypothetical protein [Pseudomonas morbosilactucae]
MAPRRLLGLLLGTLLLSGCSIYRDYDQEMQLTTEPLSAGDPDSALGLLEQHNPWRSKDLLYYFEKGELLRTKGDLIDSQLTWRRADREIFKWEEQVRFDTGKYLAQLGSFLINDKVRRYDGYDYEKVMLTTQMALNLLDLNDFDGARTEIKKTHEREALIAGVRDKEYLRLEQQARDQGIDLQYKDLQGYPVATLDAPEVLELKNSYQSAFSHYLAGFVYQALGERTLAAPGYRKAIELRPHTPLLEQALRDLDKPAARADQSEVLIIVQSGLAPARDSVRVPLMVDVKGQPTPTLMSFPVIKPDTSTPPISHISVNGRPQPLTLLNSTSAMSRRALHDDMPGIILRTNLRAQLAASRQAALRKKNPKLADEDLVMLELREKADTRTWRTLPDNTQVVRLRLKKGEQHLSVANSPPIKVKVDLPYQVINLRVVGRQVFVSGQAVRARDVASRAR